MNYLVKLYNGDGKDSVELTVLNMGNCHAAIKEAFELVSGYYVADCTGSKEKSDLEEKTMEFWRLSKDFNMKSPKKGNTKKAA